MAPALSSSRMDPICGWCGTTASPTNYNKAALLKLTSGSTGLPKAILTAECHLAADAERIVRTMGLAENDIQLAVIPLSHAYGFGNLLMPLLLQGTAIVLRDSFIPSQMLADARDFARAFSRVCRISSII